MDILSEIINDSNWRGDLLARHSFYKAWGLKFPCDKSAGFHIVTQGKCYARYKKKNIELHKGDILFVARGFTHELVSNIFQKTEDITHLKTFVEPSIDAKNLITTFVSVRYEIGDAPMHPFFLELPDIIYVKSEEISSHHPLNTIMILISQELDRGIGSDILIKKLSDILLYYVIRHWMEGNPSESPGWLLALKDEKILRVLQSIHVNYSKAWTLDTLANSVGISRASLATRFRNTLGLTPMDYLSKTRIEKGKQFLFEEKKSLEEVARLVGYSSAFAFSKAYKRVNGFSPITHRTKKFKKAI